MALRAGVWGFLSRALAPAAPSQPAAQPALSVPLVARGRPGWLGRLTRLGGSREGFPNADGPSLREADAIGYGGCNICFNSCPAKFFLKEGRVIGITGNDEDPLWQGRCCPKVQSETQLFNSPHRLLHPLKRVGPRGSARFERIGWDRALDEVAARLAAVRDTHGPEALAIFTGTRTGMLTTSGVVPLFAGLWGTPNQQTTSAFCGQSTDVAWRVTQGFRGPGNAFTSTDLGTTDFYLFVGDNMAETRPVYFGMLNDWRLRRGGRLVAVDPRLSVTASKADEWLPIRPGTDLALALALLQVVCAEGLLDREFCASWTLGWEEIRDFVLEQGYSPEWAAPIVDLPAETIRRLAREFATTRNAVLVLNRGLTQHSNGVQTIRAFMMLAALTGHWGRKGAGVVTITGNAPIGARPPAERVHTPSRPAVRQTAAGWLEAMRHGRPYPLRALIAGSNPLSLWPDQQASREALSALDLIVHVELFPNETSAYADYVFPAATSIEFGEVNRSNEERRVVWIEKLIDPPGEARSDLHFWIDLGRRFGFQDVLREEYKDSAVFWDAEMLRNPLVRGLTVARLRRSPGRWARAPLLHEDDPEIETLFEEGSTFPGEPAGKRFPTPSGKLELWTPALEAQFNAVGLSARPEFYSEPGQLVPLPRLEYLDDDGAPGVPSPFFPGAHARRARIVPGAAPDGEFDLTLVTGRPPTPHFHSWTHWFWQPQEQWPDQFVQLHPDTAAARKIADGDRVTIETTHGSVEALAWVYPGIRPDSVYVPIGWGERQPYNPWRSVNWLTGHLERDPASEQTNMKTTLCRLRRSR